LDENLGASLADGAIIALTIVLFNISSPNTAPLSNCLSASLIFLSLSVLADAPDAEADLLTGTGFVSGSLPALFDVSVALGLGALEDSFV
jgi:hypothetical protein